jgi:hypothetical protein
MSSTTSNFAPATVRAIAHVGSVVTYANAQWTVHSVEGDTWYAFLEDDGTITVDASMTRADWIKEPFALIVPAGCVIGEGFGKEVPLAQVRRGVCLSKSYR